MKYINSYCGINCKECKNYLKNVNCRGCKKEEVLIEDCPTKKCCIEKNIIHCGECLTFPCEMMKSFYDSTEFRKNGFSVLSALIK